MKQDLDVFAARLRELRWEKNWRQEDLAEKSGLTQADISRYECGERGPTGESMVKLCRALDCTMDYLMFEKAARRRLTAGELSRLELMETFLDLQESEGFLLQLLLMIAVKLLHKPPSPIRKGALRVVQTLIKGEGES